VDAPLLGIAAALVNARNGFLLIDGFENGLYYAAQVDLWRLIFQAAHRLNVQVFATTHSWDCIEGFQKAAQEDNQEEGMLIRLEYKKGEVASDLSSIFIQGSMDWQAGEAKHRYSHRCFSQAYIVVQPTMLNCVPSAIPAKRVGVPPLSEPKKSVTALGLPGF